MYKIFNEDCRATLKKLEDKSIDGVLTSPFYNTSRSTKTYNTLTAKDGYACRYDVHADNLSDEEYVKFTVDLFNEFDRVIKEKGCVLYNISYGSENTHLMWLTIADIIRKTDWIVADDIIWKKKSAIPNNRSSNKLTLGMGCNNTTEDKDLFAQEVGYADMDSLLSDLQAKGWTVETQYNGRPTTTYGLRRPSEDTLPIFAKLEEVEEHADYTSEDGSKKYRLDWFHETTGSTEGYMQYATIEEVVAHFNIKPIERN